MKPWRSKGRVEARMDKHSVTAVSALAQLELWRTGSAWYSTEVQQHRHLGADVGRPLITGPGVANLGRCSCAEFQRKRLSLRRPCTSGNLLVIAPRSGNPALHQAWTALRHRSIVDYGVEV